ncbi:MAG: type II toxin-antitoxin system RelB/DinJ family antitoxin [Anaerolineaceae bacterium]
MNKTSVISARIDPGLKSRAERVFKGLGLTASQAITLFYKQVELREGLPFRVQIPNRETAKALDDAQHRRNLESFDSIEELLDNLGD